MDCLPPSLLILVAGSQAVLMGHLQLHNLLILPTALRQVRLRKGEWSKAAHGDPACVADLFSMPD